MIGLEIIDYSMNDRIMEEATLTDTGRQMIIGECNEMIKRLQEIREEDG